MAYDPTRYDRRSIRLPTYDYAGPGMYFVTVCAHRRRPLFGGIVGETVRLSAEGAAVADALRDIPRHFAGVHLDAWVVMPDHVHVVLVIRDTAAATRSDGTAAALGPTTGAGATHASPPRIAPAWPAVAPHAVPPDPWRHRWRRPALRRRRASG